MSVDCCFWGMNNSERYGDNGAVNEAIYKTINDQCHRLIGDMRAVCVSLPQVTVIPKSQDCDLKELV